MDERWSPISLQYMLKRPPNGDLAPSFMDIPAVRPPPHHLSYKEHPNIDSTSLQSLSETGENVPPPAIPGRNSSISNNWTAFERQLTGTRTSHAVP